MQKRQKPIVVALLFLISSCQSTMEPISDTDELPLQLSIAVGDTVRVLTKYGDRPTFEVTEVTEDALTGREQSIRYDDMAFVEKRSGMGSQGNTLTVILAIVGGAVIVEGLSNIPPGFPSVQ